MWLAVIATRVMQILRLLIGLEALSTQDIYKYGRHMCGRSGQPSEHRTCIFSLNTQSCAANRTKAMKTTKSGITNVVGEKALMRCVMCTTLPGRAGTEAFCQLVDGHTVCSFVSNLRSCVFTTKGLTQSSTQDELEFNRKVFKRLSHCLSQLHVKPFRSFSQKKSGDIIQMTKKLCENKYPSLNRRDVRVYRRDRKKCKHGTFVMIQHNQLKQLHQSFLTGQESINCFQEIGSLPLIMTFAYAGKLKQDVFELFLGVGADLSLRGNQNETVLSSASSGKFIKAVEYLVQIGLDMEARCSLGFTPFLRAVLRGALDVLNYLIHAGCNVNVVSYNGLNALHCAAYSGKMQVVDRILALNCCDLGAKTIMARTAYDIAIKKKFSEIAVKLLIASG